MNIKRIISVFLILILLTMCFNSIDVNATTQDFIDGLIKTDDGVVTIYGPHAVSNYEDATEQVITKYKAIMVFIGGIITVTLVGVMVIQLVKLSTLVSDSKQRAEVIKGILLSGISASLMGSITLLVGLFYGALR